MILKRDDIRLWRSLFEISAEESTLLSPVFAAVVLTGIAINSVCGDGSFLPERLFSSRVIGHDGFLAEGMFPRELLARGLLAGG